MSVVSPQVASTSAALPGAVIIARIRRVLVVSMIALVGYSSLMAASKGYCAGGIDADGGFTDAAGNHVDTVPSCVQLALGPSPLVWGAIALVVLVAVSRVLAQAEVSDALKVLDRAAVIVYAIAIVALVISHVWFAMIPVTEWSPTEPYAFWYPFPFGSVDMTITPMPAPVPGG